MKRTYQEKCTGEATPDRVSFIRMISSHYEEPPMEGLMELVAASFVRHGIESAAGDPAATQRIRPTDPPPPAVLPEHSFRKKPEGDVAT